MTTPSVEVEDLSLVNCKVDSSVSVSCAHSQRTKILTEQDGNCSRFAEFGDTFESTIIKAETIAHAVAEFRALSVGEDYSEFGVSAIGAYFDSFTGACETSNKARLIQDFEHCSESTDNCSFRTEQSIETETQSESFGYFSGVKTTDIEVEESTQAEQSFSGHRCTSAEFEGTSIGRDEHDTDTNVNPYLFVGGLSTRSIKYLVNNELVDERAAVIMAIKAVGRLELIPETYEISSGSEKTQTLGTTADTLAEIICMLVDGLELKMAYKLVAKAKASIDVVRYLNVIEIVGNVVNIRLPRRKNIVITQHPHKITIN